MMPRATCRSCGTTMVVYPAPGGRDSGTDLFPNHDRDGKRAPKGSLSRDEWCSGARAVVGLDDYAAPDVLAEADG